MDHIPVGAPRAGFQLVHRNAPAGDAAGGGLFKVGGDVQVPRLFDVRAPPKVKALETVKSILRRGRDETVADVDPADLGVVSDRELDVARVEHAVRRHHPSHAALFCAFNEQGAFDGAVYLCKAAGEVHSRRVFRVLDLHPHAIEVALLLALRMEVQGACRVRVVLEEDVGKEDVGVLLGGQLDPDNLPLFAVDLDVKHAPVFRQAGGQRDREERPVVAVGRD
mmetsp:Transcript_9760/g.30479  ORF Transcript_9760/g.30479 Transcript_9760/m.30479 type:complete len:223 (+) Transcript_9760:1325-1993(+)